MITQIHIKDGTRIMNYIHVKEGKGTDKNN